MHKELRLRTGRLFMTTLIKTNTRLAPIDPPSNHDAGLPASIIGSSTPPQNLQLPHLRRCRHHRAAAIAESRSGQVERACHVRLESQHSMSVDLLSSSCRCHPTMPSSWTTRNAHHSTPPTASWLDKALGQDTVVHSLTRRAVDGPHQASCQWSQGNQPTRHCSCVP